MVAPVTEIRSRLDADPRVQLHHALQIQRDAMRRDGAPTYQQRMDTLQTLQDWLVNNQDRIAQAISRDFGNRSAYESLIAEVFTVINEIKDARHNLKKWMKPTKMLASLQYLPARVQLRCQPVGVVGVIGAWNYPVQLSLSPLVGAVAAGNHVMLKPSEMSPASAELMAEMAAELFKPEYIAVCLGEDVEHAAAFSSLPFDHLIFTGSTRIGRMVMRAASENLTPVTLELGGKSPAILGSDFDAKLAAKRIVKGKFINAGQTCVAPDHILVPQQRCDEFVQALQAAGHAAYPSFSGNPNYTTIHNERHYQRMQQLLDDAEAKGATLLPATTHPEAADETTRTMPPTLVINPTAEMTVMQEEIFGPILPIVTYNTLDDAIDQINHGERPLAMYFFGHDKAEQDRVLTKTIAGGVTVNDTLYHLADGKLPFGGIGASGMGHYHGHYGFLTFSKQKPVFYQPKFSILDKFSAPYGTFVDFMMRILVGKPKQ